MGWGVEEDKVEAFEWYESSAKQGHSGAQNSLGFFFENGMRIKDYDNDDDDDDDMEKDIKKAFYWYQKSATNDNNIAQYNLGRCYRYGLGIEKDKVKAFE